MLQIALPRAGAVIDGEQRMTNIPEAQKPFVQRFLDLTKNEPWVFGLPVGGEREFLREFGLEVREMFTVGGEDSAKRYLTRADGTQVGAQAIAEAMARMVSTPPTPRPRRERSGFASISSERRCRMGFRAPSL